MVVGVAVCRDCRRPVNGCSRCRKSVVVSLMIMYDDIIDINAGTFGRNAMIRVVLSPPMSLLVAGFHYQPLFIMVEVWSRCASCW